MTITQTVEIPESRRVFLEFPPESPIGMAKLELTIIPVADEPHNKKIRLTKEMIDEMLQNSPHTRSLSGILSGMGDVDLAKVRMERLAKHL